MTLAKLWILGTAAWGHKWTSSLGETPLTDSGGFTAQGALWAAQLHDLHPEDILGAAEYFAGRLDWPPSLAELRKRSLGIPSLEEVRAHLGDRSHPFVRMTWLYLDGHAFTRADQRDAERQLRNAYDYAVERRLAGDEPPPNLTMLARDPERPYDPPELVEAMRQAKGRELAP